MNAKTLPAVEAPMQTPVMQHTPGPWRADFAMMGGCVQGFSIVAEHGTHWHPVAYQSTYQHTNSECYEPAERQANARLIAAAPDMLGALLGLRAMGGLGVHQKRLIDDALRKVAGDA